MRSRGPLHASNDRIPQRSTGIACGPAFWGRVRRALVTSLRARPGLLWALEVRFRFHRPGEWRFPASRSVRCLPSGRSTAFPQALCLCHCSLAAGLAAPTRSELLLRAMSRPSSVSPRPPAPSGGGAGGGGGGPASCGPGGGGRAKGLKDIRIDEEVKIAVNIALERFRYGDQRGEASDGGP